MSLGNAIGLGFTSYAGGEVDALDYGFSISNSGDDNIAAWESIPSGTTVNITEVGTYDISSTMWLKSNTTYKFSSGITLRKETGSSFSHILANENAPTSGADSNIKVYGNGLILDSNGIETSSAYNAKALFQFINVDNFIVDNIIYDDITLTSQYVLHFCICSNGTISNLDVNSNKDPFGIIGGHDIDCENLKLYSRDDAIFLGIGYPGNLTDIDDTYNINFNNTEVGTPETLSEDGWFARIWGRDWDDWTTKVYPQYQFVVNGGRIYGKNNDASGVASVAPTHTSGAVTGADGIEWEYIQDGTQKSATVTNVVFKNSTLTSDRMFLQLGSGLEENKANGYIDGIIIDNITLPTGYTKLPLSWIGFVKDFTIKNSTLPANVFNASGGGYGLLVKTGVTKSYFENLILDNVDITLPSGRALIYIGSDFDGYQTDVEKLTCLNSTNITLTDTPLIKVGSSLTALRRLSEVVMTDCTVTASGGSFIEFRNGHGINGVTLTRVVLIDMFEIFSARYADQSSVITLNDCEFSSSLAYLVAVLNTGCDIDFVADGTKWIDPSGVLFTKTAGTATDLSVNVTNSTGIVTPSKVRNNTDVEIINFDLDYV